MKVRAGFVSNSSSSSYVIVIPKNFDVNKISNEEIDKCYVHDYDTYITDDGSVDYDKVRKEIVDCIEQGGIWHESNYGLFSICSDLLDKYSISSIETGPEGGEISIIKQANLERLLEKFNGENQ
jgi:hypothetical protein